MVNILELLEKQRKLCKIFYRSWISKSICIC